MRRAFIALSMLALAACSCSQGDAAKAVISGNEISSNYFGNGAEWDPYDEAASWGHAMDNEDWDMVFSRLDVMRPGYIRCMINSPYRYFDGGSYDPERNIAEVEKLLSYCQNRGINVVWGEYNPPRWDMAESMEWVRMSVDYLARLVLDKGFTCIRHFIIFNEPDGNWAAPDGDFDMWSRMLDAFDAEMASHPGLKEKVSLAGPDAVIDYKNPRSEYDCAGWVSQTAATQADKVGVYDVHAYPGQKQVRSGEFAALLADVRKGVPEGRQIVLGEAGYKYWRSGDEALMAEYNRRVEGHPFTKGSDCNMLVYDNFYGVDMALLAVDAMNAGYSGLAVWMLDDSMHTNGDSGKTEDVKIWGMWNTLGEKVFGMRDEMKIRPWFWAWSLVCGCFPAGCSILETSLEGLGDVRMTACRTADGCMSAMLVNWGDEPGTVSLCLDAGMPAAGKCKVYVYSEERCEAEVLEPTGSIRLGRRPATVVLPAHSVTVISNLTNE